MEQNEESRVFGMLVFDQTTPFDWIIDIICYQTPIYKLLWLRFLLTILQSDLKPHTELKGWAYITQEHKMPQDENNRF